MSQAAFPPYQTPLAGQRRDGWMFLGILAFLVFYITYEQHFPIKIDLKGVNLTNILFVLVLIMIKVKKTGSASPTPLKTSLILYLLTLIWSFLIGLVNDSSDLDGDLFVLKNDAFYPLLFFLFYHVADNVRTMRVVFGAILFTVFLAALQVFRQTLDFGLVGTYLETHRASGPFGTESGAANSAAVYFVIFVPLYFIVALILKSRPLVRLAALTGGVLGMAAIFFTYSRQAYFIFALLMLLMLVRRSAVLGIILLLVLANYQLWAPEGMIARIEMTQQTDQYGDAQLDESTESRFIIWGGAAELIKQSPWGIGLHHFARNIGRVVPKYANYDAHNFYVRYTTEAGVVSIIIVVILLINLLILGVRVERLKVSEESAILGTCMIVSTLAVILGSLYGSRFQDAEVVGNYWVLAGITARFYTLQKEARASGVHVGAAPVSPAASAARPSLPEPPLRRG